jgi:hypothetical protein
MDRNEKADVYVLYVLQNLKRVIALLQIMNKDKIGDFTICRKLIDLVADEVRIESKKGNIRG